MSNLEVQGIIHSIDETRSYGQNGFTKREFVIQLSGEGVNPTYPNYVALELLKDKCAILDTYQVGEEIKVSFNLSGRLWNAPGKPEKCFTSLQAWRIEKLSANANANPTDAGYGSSFNQGGYSNNSSSDTFFPSDNNPFSDDVPF